MGTAPLLWLVSVLQSCAQPGWFVMFWPVDAGIGDSVECGAWHVLSNHYERPLMLDALTGKMQVL